MAIVVPTPNTTITSAWGKSVADAINALQLPRELAYAQITANKTVTATVEAAADLVVAAPAVTFDGNPVIVEFFAPAVVPATVVAASVNLWLWLDGAPIGRLATVSTPAAAQFYVPVFATRRLTPTAGSHTFTIGATQQLGNGAIAAGSGGAGAYLPAYVRITRAT